MWHVLQIGSKICERIEKDSVFGTVEIRRFLVQETLIEEGSNGSKKTIKWLEDGKRLYSFDAYASGMGYCDVKSNWPQKR